MGSVLRIVNGILRMQSGSTYDETYVVPNGGLTSGSNITLPAAGTYNSDELEVFLDGQVMEVGVDYNFVGSPPRTQIQIIIDLYAGERVRFKV